MEDGRIHADTEKMYLRALQRVLTMDYEEYAASYRSIAVLLAEKHRSSASISRCWCKGGECSSNTRSATSLLAEKCGSTVYGQLQDHSK